MTWFVVSFINIVELIAGEQTEYPVSEEFYLYEAHSEQELQAKIESEKQIINDAGRDGIHYYGQVARQYCAGVRKIKSIFNQPPLHIDCDPPADGTELIHSYMTVSSLADVKKLVEGKAVIVNYLDDDNEEEG